jgi:hypothetical protein
MFREIYGEEVRRGWQARAGSDAPDIEGVPGWWLECKVGARPNPVAAIEQATDAVSVAKDDRIPLAVCKQDRHHPTVTMRLEHFMDLLRKWRQVGII